MGKIKIKKIDENKNVIVFNTIKDAAMSIETNFELWKVEMLIINAINNKKRAFKCKWFKEIA